MNANIIKSIYPHICPHCNKDIYVSLQSSSPIVSEVMTEKNMLDAKEEVIKAAKEKLSGEDLESTLKWLNDENTVFGKEDVKAVIESFNK